MSNTPIHCIVGTQMGSAEAVSDHLIAYLQSHSFIVEQHINPTLEDIPQKSLWIICTSTYGAGDPPEDFANFYTKFTTSKHLDVLSIMIIGLGDSSYDTYNLTAKTLVEHSNRLNIPLIDDPIFIDAQIDQLPEENIEKYFDRIVDKIKSHTHYI